MKNKITGLILMAIVFLGGCAAYQGKPKKVVLKHPETLDFVTCTVSRWETNSSYEENLECVERYKKMGYVVWGENN